MLKNWYKNELWVIRYLSVCVAGIGWRVDFFATAYAFHFLLTDRRNVHSTFMLSLQAPCDLDAGFAVVIKCNTWKLIVLFSIFTSSFLAIISFQQLSYIIFDSFPPVMYANDSYKGRKLLNSCDWSMRAPGVTHSLLILHARTHHCHTTIANSPFKDLSFPQNFRLLSMRRFITANKCSLIVHARTRSSRKTFVNGS